MTNPTEYERVIEADNAAVAARIRVVLGVVREECAMVTDIDNAAAEYLAYVELHSYLPEAERTAGTFREVFPMVVASDADIDQAFNRAKAQKVIADAEEERRVNMMLARCRVEAAIKQHGQDSMEARMEMAKATKYLPDDVKADLDKSARELGLMPPASGYTADGEPVFTTGDLAEFYGMDVQEVEETAREHMMTVDADSIHKPQ